MTPDSPVRLLLLDDSEDDFFIFQMTLESLNASLYAVTWISEPEEAWTTLLNGTWDLALVDYYLQPEVGTEFVKRLRGQGCQCPILIRSGRSDSAFLAEVKASGADGFLDKAEMDPEKIHTILRDALNAKN